jgi:serine/threonine protein kinase
MTPGWREEPTVGMPAADGRRTLRLSGTRSSGQTVTADGDGDGDGPAAPNGWWVGPAEDPDRYELLGAGFSGGEGTTYQARYHGESGTPITVAVKLLHRPAGLTSAWPAQEDWARWRDQLQIIHQVRNEHLVQVRIIFPGVPPHRRGESTRPTGGAQDVIPCVVMEWVPGVTLDRRVNPAPAGVNPRLLIAWIGQLANAISALHSATRTAGNPLVHRDIKPGNCIITTGERLVLIDIGTLRRASAQPDPLGMHSLHYAAPEVLADLSAPRDPASDLYSLGGVAYFCLTGSDPPAAADISEDGIRAALAIPRHWRRRVARHLLPLLAADPAVRSQVRLGDWTEELRRITRRRRWPVLVAGVSVVLATVALVSPIPGRPAGPGPASPSPAAASPTSSSSAAASTTAHQTGQPVPDAQARSVAGMAAFGETHEFFGFSVHGNTVAIDPPPSFDYLWGGFLPGQDCATTVSFDMVAGQAPGLPDFGLAVAPRARLVDDQPEGGSVQYEFEAADINASPGSYIRPAILPGGAWSAPAVPRPAPDVKLRHHVVVYAEGRSMSIQIDGRPIAEYELPAVECGGVAIRAWGDAFTLTNLSVRGSLSGPPSARGRPGRPIRLPAARQGCLAALTPFPFP